MCPASVTQALINMNENSLGSQALSPGVRGHNIMTLLLRTFYVSGALQATPNPTNPYSSIFILSEVKGVV